MDPRSAIIEHRLEEVKRILVVAGPKGGVGKSSVAAVMALLLAKTNKVGLLDLDFTCPSAHIILGAEKSFPEERNGIIPPRIGGVSLMSVFFFSGEKSLALRGNSLTNILLEILAVTIWGRLDFLIIDSAPGMGNAVLDILKYIKNPEFVVVATDSLLSRKASERLVSLLDERRIKVHRLVNMGRDIPFDDGFEAAMGSPEMLGKTEFAARLEDFLRKDLSKVDKK